MSPSPERPGSGDKYTPEGGAHKVAGRSWSDPGWYETGHVTLLGLDPNGGTRTLLDPPDGVLDLDVARDLMEAGRFGGPAYSPSVFPARAVIWVVPTPSLCLLTVIALVLSMILFFRRQRRLARAAAGSRGP